MENTNMITGNENNIVNFKDEGIIKGVITNVRKYDTFAVVQVYTRNGKNANFPSAFFFGENACLADELNKNDNVEIHGRLEPYAKRNRLGTGISFRQSFVADAVKKIDTNILSLTSHTYENAIMLSGIVDRILLNNDKVVLFSLIIGNDHQRVRIACYGRNIELVKDLKNGDTISVIASLQTSFNTYNDRTTKRETLVAQKILIQNAPANESIENTETGEKVGIEDADFGNGSDKELA